MFFTRNVNMDIKLVNPFNKEPLHYTNEGLADIKGNIFPLVNGAYRFVGKENYTSSFGFQWNKFVSTQIDDKSSSSQSKERFFTVTNWNKENLENKKVLEVGSGAGRFSQVVLKYTAAHLYSVDYSNAVEANFRNNGGSQRFHLFQASIYDLPFEKESFDKVFCFGVLQHTPDFKKSVQCLIEMVKPGGELIVDFYSVKGWYTKINAKYIFRPITKRMDQEKLLRLIEKNAGWMIKASRFFDKIGIGKFVNRFIPVCDIKNTLPTNLSEKELREWVVLDTFDMFSPAYDNPQKLSTVEAWFKEFNMKNVKAEMVKYGGNNQAAIVKGIK